MALRRVQEGSEIDGDIAFDAHRHTPLQLPRWSEQRVGTVFTGTSQTLTLPTDALVLEITCTENCYLNFGTTGVAATAVIASDASRLFLAGVQMIIVPIDGSGDPFTHVGVIQESTSGIIQIEEVR